MNPQQIIIHMPNPDPRWERISKVVVTGLYATSARDAEMTAYVDRWSRPIAEILLRRVRDALPATSLAIWRLKKISIRKIAELQGIDPEGLTWGVFIQTMALTDAVVAEETAQSFADAWIPRFSAMLHFPMPFEDIPVKNVTDGSPDKFVMMNRGTVL